MSPTVAKQTTTKDACGKTAMRVCPVCLTPAPQYVLLPDINNIPRAVDVSEFPCAACVARVSAWLNEGR